MGYTFGGKVFRLILRVFSISAILHVEYSNSSFALTIRHVSDIQRSFSWLSAIFVIIVSEKAAALVTERSKGILLEFRPTTSRSVRIPV